MKPDYAQIGRVVRTARIASGLTQREVGQALDVTPQAVSLVEKGVSRWPVDRLVDLGDVVGLVVTFRIAPEDDRGSALVGRLSALVDELNPEVMSTLESLISLWEVQHATGANGSNGSNGSSA